MDYSNIQNNFFYGISILAIIYIIFCAIDDKDTKKKYNKEFAKILSKKLKNVNELDKIELDKIQNEINKILHTDTKIYNISKKTCISSIKGGLTGYLIGGVEGAIAGGIIFGAMAPVIIMVENMF